MNKEETIKIYNALENITERIEGFYNSQKALIEETIKDATSRLASLFQKIEFEAATAEVKREIAKRMFAERAWLEAWENTLHFKTKEGTLFHLLREQILERYPLEIPPPPTEKGIPTAWRIGAVAAGGTLLGSNLLNLLPSWQGGFIIGGALGAFLLVWGIGFILFRGVPLPEILGKAAIEKRIYRLFGVKPFQFDYIAMVEKYLHLWIRGVIGLVLFTFSVERGREADLEGFYVDLLRMILELKYVSEKQLPFAIQELIEFTERQGFRMLEETSFIWDTKASAYYDTFGHVTVGNRVKVKKKPFIFNGKVIRKGMVMKEETK